MKATIDEVGIVCGTCHAPALDTVSLCARCATAYHMVCRPSGGCCGAKKASAPKASTSPARSMLLAIDSMLALVAPIQFAKRAAASLHFTPGC